MDVLKIAGVIALFVVGVASLEVTIYVVRRLWKQRKSARAARAAHWNAAAHTAFFWVKEREGRHSYCYETDLDAAINAAHGELLGTPRWPKDVRVFAVVHDLEPHVCYRFCTTCGYCSHCDKHGQCLPCGVAARMCPGDPDKARRISRELSQINWPQWCGPDVTADEVPLPSCQLEARNEEEATQENGQE